jgi:Flp pilus assembly protein TadG
MKARRPTFTSDQSGAMVVMAALLLVVLLAASALAVDYGYLVWVKGELQKAADAGALAGARVLGSTSNPDWATGQAAATAIVQQNKVAGKLLTDCQVEYGYWSKLTHTLHSFSITPQKNDVPAIRVTIQKSSGKNDGPVRLLFAPIFGVNNFDLRARAVAMLNAGGGWSILETGNGRVSLSNNANVNRDVGVNGDGPFKISNNAIVQGKAYLNTICSKSISNNASVQGGVVQDTGANSTLSQATSAATTAYNNFNSLANTLGTMKISLGNNQTQTLNGGATTNVVDLTRLTLSNNSILTLNAPAAGSFVVRVSGTFTLSNNSRIVLTGGITSDNVTFVRTGTGTVTLSNNSLLYGSILSPNGAISLSNNSTVYGVLVSSKNITLSNNSLLTPTIPWLPSTGSQGAVLVN